MKHDNCDWIKTHSPPPHTHTLECKERENQHSRMQGKGSNAKKSGCEKCKQKQKSSHTGKMRKQKTR